MHNRGDGVVVCGLVRALIDDRMMLFFLDIFHLRDDVEQIKHKSPQMYKKFRIGRIVVDLIKYR